MNSLPKFTSSPRAVLLSSLFEFWKNMSYSPINGGLKGVLHNSSVFYGNIVSSDLPKRLLLHTSSSINLLSSSSMLFNIFSMNPSYNASSSYYVNLNSAHFWNAAKKCLKSARHNFFAPGVFNDSGALNFLINFSSHKSCQSKHIFNNAYSKTVRINYSFSLPYFGFFSHFTLPSAVFRISSARGHLFSYKYFLKSHQSFINRAANSGSLTSIFNGGSSGVHSSLSIFSSFYINSLSGGDTGDCTNIGFWKKNNGSGSFATFFNPWLFESMSGVSFNNRGVFSSGSGSSLYLSDGSYSVASASSVSSSLLDSSVKYKLSYKDSLSSSIKPFSKSFLLNGYNRASSVYEAGNGLQGKKNNGSGSLTGGFSIGGFRSFTTIPEFYFNPGEYTRGAFEYNGYSEFYNYYKAAGFSSSHITSFRLNIDGARVLGLLTSSDSIFLMQIAYYDTSMAFLCFLHSLDFDRSYRMFCECLALCGRSYSSEVFTEYLMLSPESDISFNPAHIRAKKFHKFSPFYMYKFYLNIYNGEESALFYGSLGFWVCSNLYEFYDCDVLSSNYAFEGSLDVVHFIALMFSASTSLAVNNKCGPYSSILENGCETGTFQFFYHFSNNWSFRSFFVAPWFLSGVFNTDVLVLCFSNNKGLNCTLTNYLSYFRFVNICYFLLWVPLYLFIEVVSLPLSTLDLNYFMVDSFFAEFYVYYYYASMFGCLHFVNSSPFNIIYNLPRSSLSFCEDYTAQVLVLYSSLGIKWPLSLVSWGCLKQLKLARALHGYSNLFDSSSLFLASALVDHYYSLLSEDSARKNTFGFRDFVGHVKTRNFNLAIDRSCSKYILIFNHLFKFLGSFSFSGLRGMYSNFLNLFFNRFRGSSFFIEANFTRERFAYFLKLCFYSSYRGLFIPYLENGRACLHSNSLFNGFGSSSPNDFLRWLSAPSNSCCVQHNVSLGPSVKSTIILNGSSLINFLYENSHCESVVSHLNVSAFSDNSISKKICSSPEGSYDSILFVEGLHSWTCYLNFMKSLLNVNGTIKTTIILGLFNWLRYNGYYLNRSSSFPNSISGLGVNFNAHVESLPYFANNYLENKVFVESPIDAFSYNIPKNYRNSPTVFNGSKGFNAAINKPKGSLSFLEDTVYRGDNLEFGHFLNPSFNNVYEMSGPTFVSMGFYSKLFSNNFCIQNKNNGSGIKLCLEGMHGFLETPAGFPEVGSSSSNFLHISLVLKSLNLPVCSLKYLFPSMYVFLIGYKFHIYRLNRYSINGLLSFCFKTFCYADELQGRNSLSINSYSFFLDLLSFSIVGVLGKKNNGSGNSHLLCFLKNKRHLLNNSCFNELNSRPFYKSNGLQGKKNNGSGNSHLLCFLKNSRRLLNNSCFSELREFSF